MIDRHPAAHRSGACLKLCSKSILFFSALVLWACGAPKSYIVLLDSPDSEHPSVVTVTNQKGTRTLSSPGEYVGLNESQQAAPRRAAQSMIERDFSAALAAEPDAPRRFRLYFFAGGVQLTEDSAALIRQILAEVRRRSVPDVAIVGHTDTRGSYASNAKLAARRAEVVKDIVIDAGIDPQLIAVTSLGESRPLVATADNVDEPKNRRVEVVIR